MGSVGMTNATVESLVVEFFKRSQGQWKSQRRYYMLNQDTDPQEVESSLEISFLERGAPELRNLADLHQLEDRDALLCGTKITWNSSYTNKNRKASYGSTSFGIVGNKLYRDRGFATNKPVLAICSLTNPDILCLRTEYSGSVFEEEIRLIGHSYRTRQTIISRAGEEITIGQYLETRILNN